MYIDENIHNEAGFILAAYIYADSDLSSLVDSILLSNGLIPGVDEFKSSLTMKNSKVSIAIRDEIKVLITKTKVGLTVIASNKRETLGREILVGLKKIIHSNDLDNINVNIYIDEGIKFISHEELESDLINCRFHYNQDSKLIKGIQVADCAAHTMSIILKCALGLLSKKIRINEPGVYENHEVDLGFELWTSLRWHFFHKGNKYTIDDFENGRVDSEEFCTVDTGPYSVHIAESCTDKLHSVVNSEFGKMYLGCIH